MSTVVIFDGDNTLWDTDKLFACAQCAMLTSLRNSLLQLDPQRDFTNLRKLDREIYIRTGIQEYNFEWLALALIGYSRGLPSEVAVKLAMEAPKAVPDADLIVSREAAKRFKEALSNPAELLPGSREVLAFIKEHRRKRQLVSILISEGNRDRVLRTIRFHGLNENGELFDYMLFGKKDVHLFQQARSLGIKILREKHARVIIIGDSLTSDIRPANLVGAISVYKPAAFLGEETPLLPEDMPDYTIASLHELLPILSLALHNG